MSRILPVSNEIILEEYKTQSGPTLAKKYNCCRSVIYRIVKESGGQIKTRTDCFRKYPVDSDYFKRWSLNMAWILGFTMADGYVMPSDCRLSYGVAIKDQHILEFIRNEISPTSVIRFQSSRCNDKIHKKAEYRIYHPEIIKDLDTYGIIRAKTGKERLKNIKQEYLASYLLGEFDGDGCIEFKCRKLGDSRNRIRFRLACLNDLFLEELRDATINVGRIIRQKSCFVWEISNKKDIHTLYDYMYSNHGFYLKRKKDIFDNIATHFGWKIHD